MDVDRQHLSALSEFENLQAIDMCFSGFSTGRSDEAICLQAIAKLPRLEGLNLWEVGITDRGLQELIAAQNLKNLELAENVEITDVGLIHLAQLKNLRRLSLGSNSATKEGVARLRAALPKCEIECWNE